MSLVRRLPVVMSFFVLMLTLSVLSPMAPRGWTTGKYYEDVPDREAKSPDAFVIESNGSTGSVRSSGRVESRLTQSADASRMIHAASLRKNSVVASDHSTAASRDDQRRPARLRGAEPFQEDGNSRRDSVRPVEDDGSLDLIHYESTHDLPKEPPETVESVIDGILTGRYQSPATRRALRVMSEQQATNLFREVSERIDARSLEPARYENRVRRAMRNLHVAMGNEAFLDAAGISSMARPSATFRHALSHLASAGGAQDLQDAVGVMTSVMRQGEEIAGISEAIVGFEFTSASLDALDPFSGLELADPESVLESEHRELIRTTNLLDEQIVGVGLEVREDPDGLKVVRCLKESPAAEANIQAGDVIHHIDGQRIRGMKLTSSVDLLKGPAGSEMTIQISGRDGRERELVLIRRTVRVWTVHDVRILDGTEVGYFSLSRFSQNSPAEVDKALELLHRQGMKSLVVDIRGNPGGLLNTCVEICDRFLPCGTIVSTRGRLTSDDMVLKATYGKTWRVPIVVMIDGDSASASEIFAAAIRENRRGLVVGSRSYGKGTVQTHFPLTSVRGDLRLTTAEFYSPAGFRMAGFGVTPDIEVQTGDGSDEHDSVLAEAARIAQGSEVQELARAAGSCRTEDDSARNDVSLDGIIDPGHPGTTIL
ncbi:MAG: S41 family peptidase [Planctomycetota bacterium]